MHVQEHIDALTANRQIRWSARRVSPAVPDRDVRVCRECRHLRRAEVDRRHLMLAPMAARPEFVLVVGCANGRGKLPRLMDGSGHEAPGWCPLRNGGVHGTE